MNSSIPMYSGDLPQEVVAEMFKAIEKHPVRMELDWRSMPLSEAQKELEFKVSAIIDTGSAEPHVLVSHSGVGPFNMPLCKSPNGHGFVRIYVAAQSCNFDVIIAENRRVPEKIVVQSTETDI